MLQVLRKYESMKSVIDRCDDMVLDVLGASSIREARIAAESFRNGGKRLRPALLILSSMVPTGARRGEVATSLIELAAAVELIHLATLFHDDVIDEVESRRLKLSARAKYGNYVSVLAGDYALAEALLLVQRSGLHHTMPEFLRTIQVLVSGESRETRHKFDFEMNEAAYYEIISEKSASLFALSCKVGGMEGHTELADLMGHFGWNMGMAFQMIDDLDDMLNVPHDSMDCDLKNGYFALPVIRALAGLEDGYRERLIELIRGGDFTRDDEKQIIMLCEEHGGFRQAKIEIDKHLDRAGGSLARFESSEAKRMLEMILHDLEAYSGAQIHRYLEFCRASA
ncbi:MAG: polyprenyl synthetase family protein [Candidatus Krumholzibacteriia bacterium]